jgi:hypothetical protein
VASETFGGVIAGLTGTVVPQQYGVMSDDTILYYEFVPGSGSGELTGITGSLDLDTSAGDHRTFACYRLP